MEITFNFQQDGDFEVVSDVLKADDYGVGTEDEGYEQARRVFNGMIDKHPSVIVRAANAGDVIAAVNHAREGRLDLSVRGGSHSGCPDRLPS